MTTIADDEVQGKRGRTSTVGQATAAVGSGAIGSEPLDRLFSLTEATSSGLNAAEAQRRLAIFGPNDAATAKRTPPWVTRPKNIPLFFLSVCAPRTRAKPKGKRG